VDGATFKKQVEGLKPGQNYQFRICAVNRMGQGNWSQPSAQHVTEVGVPEPPEQPTVIRTWFRPWRIVFCWHAPLATVEGTAIQQFHIQCAGEGYGFAGRAEFHKFITWKEGRILAQQVEAALLDQIREDADIWRQSGPATKGKTFAIPNDTLLEFSNQAATIGSDVTLSPEERCIRLRRLDRQRRRSMARLANEERKRQRELRSAKVGNGILMAAAFEDLKPGFDYRCRVSAVSSVGEGPFSPPTFNSRTPANTPATPACPVVAAVSQTAVRIRWATPLDNGSAITRFEVRRDSDFDEIFEYSRRNSEVTFSGLRAGKRYAFQVRAFNQIGPSNWSSWSERVSTLTALPLTPGRPVVCEATITTVTLECVKPDNSGKIISKMVFQRRELRPGGVNSEWANEMSFPAAPGAGGTTSYVVVSPLGPNSVYQFRCAAVNIHGQSNWSLPSFRIRTLPAEPPTAPQHPRVTKIHFTSVDVTWVASDSKGSPVIGHVLELKRLRRVQAAKPIVNGTEYSVDDSNCSPLVSNQVDGIVTSLDIGYRSKYQAQNLEPSANYVFRVSACNGQGQGAWSRWSDVFSGGLPQEPS